MKPFRIQYVGNLFVDKLFDHFTKLVRPNRSPYLALCGNIGSPVSPTTVSFLEYCSDSWENVFWIPGPYELTQRKANGLLYYRDNLERIQELAAKKRITLLHQGSVVVNDVRIMGTTLWTPCLPGRIERKYDQAEFQDIYKHDGAVNPVDLAEWNQDDVQFLQRELLTAHEEPCVVLTHHLPHPALLSTQASITTLKRVGLETNLLGHLLKPPVRLWLAGSSGSAASCIFPNKVFASVNSLYEYPMRTRLVKNPGFDPLAYAEIGVHEAFPFYATMFYGPRQKQQMLM
jgi:hypothetical protein